MNDDLGQRLLAFLDELTEEQQWAFLVLACAAIETIIEQRKDNKNESVTDF